MTQPAPPEIQARCGRCQDTEWVCGVHPHLPSAPSVGGPDNGCSCSFGVPCPDCHPAGVMGDGDGPTIALEPATLPNRGLTAAEAACFIEKEVG